MGLTSCRWITVARTLARRRRGAQPASSRLPCSCRTRRRPVHPHLCWAAQPSAATGTSDGRDQREERHGRERGRDSRPRRSATATTGGVAAASAFWPVFWMPRARPAQDEPGVLGDRGEGEPVGAHRERPPRRAGPRTASAERGGRAPRPAPAAISPVARARMRIGPHPAADPVGPVAGRQPGRRRRRPRRPPAARPAVGGVPAAGVDQEHQRERGHGELRDDQQRAGGVDPPQHRVPVGRAARCARRAAARRGPGPARPATTSAAAARQNTPRNSSARGPARGRASVGRVSAATATPSGCALCRMPMARPALVRRRTSRG